MGSRFGFKAPCFKAESSHTTQTIILNLWDEINNLSLLFCNCNDLI